MATLRNLAIGILKTAGHTAIAAACRHARDATRTLETLGLDPARTNGHDATTPGPWRLLYSSANLHRLALEEGEVIVRGLRSLRRPARPPGSRR